MKFNHQISLQHFVVKLSIMHMFLNHHFMNKEKIIYNKLSKSVQNQTRIKFENRLILIRLGLGVTMIVKK